MSFHTLGCKLNFSESSTLARLFAARGFERAATAAEAGICVVNTCSVTAASDKKCRSLIRHIHRENPAAVIVVTGCYAQLRPEETASIEGVDIVLGNNEKELLVERVVALLEDGGREAGTEGHATGRASQKGADCGESIAGVVCLHDPRILLRHDELPVR
ncbi:hypothetical protein FACS1894159_11490 [Bacteroidia bacterium]|nr:hypothetical protein FACS1894159_11490 [Bacteroidia bacterium]